MSLRRTYLLALLALPTWLRCGIAEPPGPAPRGVTLGGVPAFSLPGAAPVPVSATLTTGGSGEGAFRYAFRDDCGGSFTPALVGPTAARGAAARWAPPEATRASCRLSVTVTDEGGAAVSDSQAVRVAYLVNDASAAGEPARCEAPSHASLGAALRDQEVAAGSLVDVCPGAYAESLVLTRSLTLSAVGPGVLLRPKEAGPGGAIIDVGDVTDGGAVTPRVEIAGLVIDGSLVSAAPPPRFRGVAFRPGAGGALRRSIVQGIKPAAIGVQNGFAVTVAGPGADVDIEDCSLSDFGKNALSVSAPQGARTVNFRGNRVRGLDPTALGTQLSQNGLVYRDDTGGEISGNLFFDLGPSGAPNPSAGGARVATDLTVGYAILILDSVPAARAIKVSGNTFRSVQGVLYDGRRYADEARRAAAIRADAFLRGNAITGGRFIAYGPLGDASVIAGVRDDDPNQLNYALTDLDCSYYSACALTLGGPASYTVTTAAVKLASPVTLLGSGGAVTVSYPGAVPAGLRAGAGVTLGAR